MNIESLQNEKAKLLARVRQIDDSLRLASSVCAVEIYTQKNIRNTGNLTCNPNNVSESDVLVYADKEMTEPAWPSSHNGFISSWSAAKLRECGGLDGIDLV